MTRPKIATHITEKTLENTMAMIENEALRMTKNQITLRCQELIAEANSLYSKAINSENRIYARWADELMEMVFIWSTMTPGLIQYDEDNKEL